MLSDSSIDTLAGLSPSLLRSARLFWERVAVAHIQAAVMEEDSIAAADEALEGWLARWGVLHDHKGDE